MFLAKSRTMQFIAYKKSMSGILELKVFWLKLQSSNRGCLEGVDDAYKQLVSGMLQFTSLWPTVTQFNSKGYLLGVDNKHKKKHSRVRSSKHPTHSGMRYSKPPTHWWMSSSKHHTHSRRRDLVNTQDARRRALVVKTPKSEKKKYKQNQIEMTIQEHDHECETQIDYLSTGTQVQDRDIQFKCKNISENRGYCETQSQAQKVVQMYQRRPLPIFCTIFHSIYPSISQWPFITSLRIPL